MPRLEIRFLGTFDLTLDGRSIRLDRRKAEALLAYLVVEKRAHRRSELALLLWPEQARAQGRAALRRTLCALTGALGEGWAEVDRNCVAIARAESFWVDVATFVSAVVGARRHSHGARQACDDCVDGLAEAAALHRGDFLLGLALRDAPSFDEWQHVQAERLRELRAEALEGLVRYHMERAEHDEAFELARQWVLQDPFDETSHETLMRLFIEAGRRSAALRLYEEYSRRLENELDIEPPPTMSKLCRQVRARSSTPRSPSVAWGHDEPRERACARFLENVPSRIVDDFDGVAAAWRWACRRRMSSAIDGALEPLHGHIDRLGLYREGIDLLELALGAVGDEALLGRLLARQGALYTCIGRLRKARALLEAGLRDANEGRDPSEVAYCENRLGYVLFALGEFSRGRRLLRSSVHRYRNASCASGLAWALNVWGHLSIGRNEANSILTEGLYRGKGSNDEGRVASVLNSLGKEALVRGNFAAAQPFLERSLALRRSRGHRIGIADALTNLGAVHLGMGNQRDAVEALAEGLDVARSIDARPLIAEILLGMAACERVRGATRRAIELTSSALHLPGGWRDAKDRAAKSLAELSRLVSPSDQAAAVEKGKGRGHVVREIG